MKFLFRLMMLAMLFHAITPLGVEAQNVLLQSSTPGTTQTGHMNINGTGLFGRSISIGTTSSSNNIGLNISKSLSTTSTVYGVSANISNSSSGAGYGGYFSMGGTGTGTRYGVYGTATGNSALTTYGVYGNAANTSSGDAYGGYFTTSSSGTGGHAGVFASGTANSSSKSAFGVLTVASNLSSGNVYGGSFSAFSSGTGLHYGIFVAGNGNSATDVIGSYNQADNSSTGRVFAGYFNATPSGTGEKYGVYSQSSGSASASTYGVLGSADNPSTGLVYGGYFSALSSGTGTHYGVYGVEAAGGAGAAVYAAGDFVASGTKSAVVQTSNGHRLMYAQESPEVWFEDYGQGQLVNGQAHVDLDAFFLETVSINSAHPMKVFVQLTSGEPVPVVVEKGQTGFEIRAQNQLNATFDYRVVAKRKGYENDRLRKTAAGYEDPNLYPALWAEMEKKREEEKQRQKSERELHERELKRHEPLQQEQPTQHFEAEADANLVKSNEPVEFIDRNLSLPGANALIQNHPNPFNPATKIQFEVKQAGRVTLKVYNSLGQEVASLLDQNLAAGRHSANFDATGLPSGAYFYKLSVNGFTEVKRMELVK